MEPQEALHEAQLYDLWSGLCDVALPEQAIYEILIEETQSPRLSKILKRLKKLFDQSGELSKLLKKDDPDGLSPWVTAFILKVQSADAPDLKALASGLQHASEILFLQAQGPSRSLFWHKLAFLSEHEISPTRSLKALALEAKHGGDSEFSDALIMAARRCREGSTLAGSLAKDKKTFRRLERSMLAASIGQDEILPTLERLAGMTHWPRLIEEFDLGKNLDKALDKLAESQAKDERPQSQAGNKDSTSSSVKDTISGAINSVGEMLGLNKDSKDSSDKRSIRVQPSRNQTSPSPRPAPQKRTVGPAPQARPASANPVIHIKTSRTADGAATQHQNPEPKRKATKTIGPAWFSGEEPSSDSGSNNKKTIGLPDREPTPKPAEEPKPAKKSIRIVKRDPELERQLKQFDDDQSSATLQRLKYYLVLLEQAPDHPGLAERIAEHIKVLRQRYGTATDAMDGPARKMLDDLELQFGQLTHK